MGHHARVGVVGPLCGRPHNGPYVAKLVMWRRPGQTPVPSHAAPAERHISYRVTEPEGRPSMQCPPCTRLLLTRPSTPTLGHKLALIWRSTPAPSFVVPVTRVPATPGRFESARKELCGVPDRERAGFSAPIGWRPHNQLGHIRTEARTLLVCRRAVAVARPLQACCRGLAEPRPRKTDRS
jgi:hypothetical protein